jgi:subtilisin family serine protease
MQRNDKMAENMGMSDVPTFTGRSIIVFRKPHDEDDAVQARRMQSLLLDKAGVQSVASSLDFRAGSHDAAQVDAAQAMTMPSLGIAVVADESAMALAADEDIEAVLPEKWDYLRNVAELARPPLEPDDAEFDVNPSHIRKLAQMLRMLKQVSDAFADAPTIGRRDERERLEGFADSLEATWGLQATRVPSSRYSGRNVRVAVIDTGLDITHRDFQGRRIVRATFAPAGTRDDPTNSHGTHCAGTACGSRTPVSGPRYGIAHESEIYALKVFNDAPRPGARRGDVLAAMDFAHRHGCRILSLSLGSATNGAVDLDYSRAITRLRRAGALTIAAAGNEGRIGFKVGAPASSPDAVAVAAVDTMLWRADFSNTGAALDIAGPGVDILSSVIGGGTDIFDGTSMAAPHVAGVAALWLEQDPAQTPDQLEATLRRTASRLTQSAALVGVGLVQAPQ